MICHPGLLGFYKPLLEMALSVATPFMLKLKARMEDELGVSESTSTQYLQTLYRLNNSKPFKNMGWIKDSATVQETVAKLADSTKAVYYRILGTVLGLFPSYGKVRKYWMKLSEEVQPAPSAEKSEKQEENWLSWSEVQHVADALERDLSPVINAKTRSALAPEIYNKLLDFVVLSLYTKIAPRRNKDYAVMYVVKKYNPEMNSDYNYYSREDSKFVFNNYKTAFSFGQQIVDVPDDLKKLLDSYLRHHPLKALPAFPLLVHEDGRPIHPINGITRILNRIFGKNVGSSMLRHIYLTQKYGGAMTEREDDAEAMAHSMSTQISYIKR